MQPPWRSPSFPADVDACSLVRGLRLAQLGARFLDVRVLGSEREQGLLELQPDTVIGRRDVSVGAAEAIRILPEVIPPDRK